MSIPDWKLVIYCLEEFVMPLQQKLQDYFKLALAYVANLQDIRVVGQLVFVVIVLLVSWSGVKAINTNYALQKQIASLQQQTAIQQLENNNLKLRNQYYNSSQYLELAARQNFGRAAPGEKEIVVPTQVALSYTVPVPKAPVPKPEARPSQYQRNIEAWVSFFLHRPQPPD